MPTASPAVRLACIIPQRASTSPPSATARRRYSATRRAPSSAIASDAGLASAQCSESTACESASMPVAAVSAGGIDSVRSGSTSATRGQIRGSNRFIFLWRSVSVMIAEGETSLPVPAVVGTASDGEGRGLQRAEVLPVTRVAAVGDEQGDALGRVDRRAAADPDHDLRADRAAHVGALQAVRVARIALDVVEHLRGQAGGRQGLQQRIAHAGLAQTGVGDEQCPPDRRSPSHPEPGGFQPEPITRHPACELHARRHPERARGADAGPGAGQGGVPIPTTRVHGATAWLSGRGASAAGHHRSRPRSAHTVAATL